jgi:hypothetical protein
MKSIALLVVAWTFAFVLLPSPQARADDCWMSGCRDATGYVYIPFEQRWTKRSGTLREATSDIDWHVGDKKDQYQVVDENWLFEEPGIPAVNAEVHLSKITPILSVQELSTALSSLPDRSTLEFDDAARTVAVADYEVDGEYRMGPGTVLRILGYHLVPSDGGEGLFALVQIVSDGD